ncbi:retron system putative HNH endonuclease [Gemmata massiliana]|nr:retron system putative HNH endonuclease [Gemmata massiliana]
MGTAQTAANGYPRGGAEIERQWNNFRRRKAGQEVWSQFAIAFSTKCAFCERVNAKTIDHYRPKERCPKKMFRWNNLLLCCSDCNRAKGHQFHFRNKTPLLLDPTQDDPAEFFGWNVSTGTIIAIANPDREHRATHTLAQLELNDQPLQDERAEKLKSIVYLLARVVREQPTEPDTRERLQAELRPDRPYLGILRFLFAQPNAYRPIVDDARAKLPDIDTWIAAWL